MISDGLVCDLCDIPELNLDRPWWDQSVVNEATINGSLYFALCDITMFSFECTWATYFNKDILEKNQLDTPYELVRSGAWTFDKLGEYTKDCASLNGDESFTWSADGSSVYGLASCYEFGHTGIIACGERYITNDADGTPRFSLEGDRFYNVVSKLASLCAVPANICRSTMIRRIIFLCVLLVPCCVHGGRDKGDTESPLGRYGLRHRSAAEI